MATYFALAVGTYPSQWLVPFYGYHLEGDFRPLREYHGSRALPSPSSEGTETVPVPVSEEDTPPVQLSLLDEEEKDQ